MPGVVLRELWVPQGIAELEPAADEAVRSGSNVLVIAGPGAGKTELLAQRACFLLQTGTCFAPHRILAISLKRDAARNLRERVASRCGHELGRQLDSLTFDSFCKGLVDRFRSAVPEWIRPAPDYRVLDGGTLNDRKILDLVRELPDEICPLTTAQREGLNSKALYWRSFIGRPLPADGDFARATPEDVAASGLWRFLIGSGDGSAISFPMIARLAELLLRTNPAIGSALRRTYHYLFLDEFQDTTSVHYALTRAAFLDTGTVITAVGDNKQRIMVWAGALKDVFERFKHDFSAETLRLRQNHRSAPGLVAIQAVIAKALDLDAPPAEATDDGADGAGDCRVLRFPDHEREAEHLAEMVAGWITDEKVAPRRICILTRQRNPGYTTTLREQLHRAGVRSRIENELQDLLAEPLVETLLNMMKLAVRSGEAAAWNSTVDLLRRLAKDDADAAVRETVDRLIDFLAKLRGYLQRNPRTGEELTPVLQNIMRFVGEFDFKSLYPQYLQGSWYDDTLTSFVKAMVESIGRSAGWSEVIDDVEGVGAVPIMTTHKSKGLEYHSVIFVGLEDGAHWTFAEQPSEETCGFFVTLSRAEKRVLFTFSGVRPTGWRGANKSQQDKSIKPLYDLLTEAGVQVEEYE